MNQRLPVPKARELARATALEGEILEPFAFVDSERQDVSMVIVLAGPTGSGKTRSALELARGLAGGDDSLIAGIDTEAGRMNHYKPPRGQPPGPGQFRFKHGDLKAPFTPENYQRAIEAADSAGYRVAIVDSFSHEWEGEGGLHDIAEAEIGRLVADGRERADKWRRDFDELAFRDRVTASAWKPAKQRHKRLVGRMLQLRCHLIICLRAEEKLLIQKVKKQENGREWTETQYIQTKDLPPAERWVPIVEKRFMYEATMSFVLSPDRPGVPHVVKLQDQHAGMVPRDEPLSERTGRLLAAWASGDEPAKAAPREQLQGRPKDPRTAKVEELYDPERGEPRVFGFARLKATEGTTAFEEWRHKLTLAQDHALDEINDELRRRCDDADARLDDIDRDIPGFGPTPTPATTTEEL